MNRSVHKKSIGPAGTDALDPDKPSRNLRKSSSYRARDTNLTRCPVFLNVAADARQKTLAPKYTKRSISEPGTDRPEYTVWLEYCGSGVAL
jgi:hypothetical protein